MTAAVQDNQVQRHSIALTTTLVVHGLILLFLFLYKIITPIPPFPEKEGGGSGYELALGFNELGMGDNSNSEDPSTPAAQQESTPPPAAEAEVLTSEVDDNNVTTPPKPDKPKTEKPKPEKPKPTKEQTEQAFKDKVNTMWNTTGTGSEGKGNSDVPGTAGGSIGTDKGTGIGSGTGSYKGDGWAVDLAGRTIKRKPVINDKPNVDGKVVMDIWVAPDGKVVRVSQNTSKSTTLDQSLVTIAKRAALESSFYPDPKAVGEKKGTMTFVFVLQ